MKLTIRKVNRLYTVESENWSVALWCDYYKIREYGKLTEVTLRIQDFYIGTLICKEVEVIE